MKRLSRRFHQWLLLMMKYPFRCAEHGDFEVSAPIEMGPPSVVECAVCGEKAKRVYLPLTDIWNTQGAHKTDYDKTGDKLEKLNANWSKKYGEKPPAPAKDVPKNLKDPY